MELNALEAQQTELLVETDGHNITLARMQKVLLWQRSLAEQQSKKRKTLQDPPPAPLVDAAHASRRRRRVVAAEI
jgi:hypothetical protein